MRRTRFGLCAMALMVCGWLGTAQQTPQPPPAGRGQAAVGEGQPQGRGQRGRGARTRKVVLAWADTRNGQAQHDSVSHALAVIERLGYESGAYDTFIRTDSHIISKKPLKTTGQPASGGPSLANVDAIFFMGHRDVPLDDAQKAELLSFVRDDGKGFVAAHVGLTAFESWPEFGELLGARFDGHPMNGPGVVVNEDPAFPATRHFPASFTFTDEFYQPKEYSRDKIHVLLRLDLANVPRQPEPASAERRSSARLGEDVRQGPRVLRIVRTRVRDVGHQGRPADLPRGDQVVARHDRRRPQTSSHGDESGQRGPVTQRFFASTGPPRLLR